jgi:hypothetical protein
VRLGLRRGFPALVFLALLLTGCASAPSIESSAASARNRASVLAFHAAVERGDFDAAERMLAPGYRHYVVSADGFRPLPWADFRKGNVAARAAVLAAFPDWKNTPTRVVAEGDFVSVLVLVVALPITVTHEVHDGMIFADWEVVDTGPLMRAIAPDKPPQGG